MNDHTSTQVPSEIDEPFTAEELSAALRDPDPFVRVDAVHRAADAMETIDLAELALGDDYPLVRREAVRALASVGGAEAARTLLVAAAHDLSAEVREEAVSSLAGLLRQPRAAAQA